MNKYSFRCVFTSSPVSALMVGNCAEKTHKRRTTSRIAEKGLWCVVSYYSMTIYSPGSQRGKNAIVIDDRPENRKKVWYLEKIRKKLPIHSLIYLSIHSSSRQRGKPKKCADIARSLLESLCLGLLLRGLLLEQLVLQLVCESLRMLGALWSCEMNISSTTSSDVKVLVLHARAKSDFGDGDFVFSNGGFCVGGSDVGCSASASAECSIAVISSCSFTNNFSITVSGKSQCLILYMNIYSRKYMRQRTYGVLSTPMFPAPIVRVSLGRIQIQSGKTYHHGHG